MSSEYIYDRKVVTIMGGFVALLESSHSSNDGDHTPHWHCQDFCRIEDAMEMPIVFSYYAENGMTRGVKGRKLSGEANISKWREALENAHPCPVQTIDVWFGRNYYYDPIFEIFEGIKDFAEKSDFSLKFCIEAERCAKITFDLTCEKDVQFIHSVVERNKWLQDVPASDDDDTNPRLSFHQVFTRNFADSASKSYFVSTKQGEKSLKRASSFDLRINEKIVKISSESPFGAHNLIVDEQGIVVSINPISWFCKKLFTFEKIQPGCAESLYKQFRKKLVETTEQPNALFFAQTSISEVQSLIVAEPDSWKVKQIKELNKGSVAINSMGDDGFWTVHSQSSDTFDEAVSCSGFLTVKLVYRSPASSNPEPQTGDLF